MRLELIRYIDKTPNEEIVRDILNNVPIAIELDNLRINWDES
jgi:hypothetical protein